MKPLIPIDFSLTMLFNQIYWYEDYCTFKENWTISDFKKQYQKLLKTIKNSIKVNITICDEYFKNELFKAIDDASLEIKKAEKVENINNILICFLTRFSFNLLGMEPCYQYYRNDLNLNKFRSIQYVQNPKQKKALENQIKKPK